MKLKIVMALCALAIFYSCNKGKDVAPRTVPGGATIEARLKLTGDFITNESALGRQAGNSLAYARDFRDSTIYEIIVYQENKRLYQGLYDNPDSIILKLPSDGNITVSAVVFKKGTGGGFYHNYLFGSPVPFYAYPVYAYLYNRMDTVTTTYEVDSLSNINVFYPADTTKFTNNLYSELDTYTGQTSFTAAKATPVISLNLRRIVFGVRFNAGNFTSGSLKVNYFNLMPEQTFPSSSAAYQQHIYTAAELQWSDSIYTHAVPVSLQWIKPDGNIVSLGSKNIFFKRNVLTTINVTVPSGNPVVSPIPLDTAFTGNEVIDF